MVTPPVAVNLSCGPVVVAPVNSTAKELSSAKETSPLTLKVPGERPGANVPSKVVLLPMLVILVPKVL